MNWSAIMFARKCARRCRHDGSKEEEEEKREAEGGGARAASAPTLPRTGARAGAARGELVGALQALGLARLVVRARVGRRGDVGEASGRACARRRGAHHSLPTPAADESRLRTRPHG